MSDFLSSYQQCRLVRSRDQFILCQTTGKWSLCHRCSRKLWRMLRVNNFLCCYELETGGLFIGYFCYVVSLFSCGIFFTQTVAEIIKHRETWRSFWLFLQLTWNFTDGESLDSFIISIVFLTASFISYFLIEGTRAVILIYLSFQDWQFDVFDF